MFICILVRVVAHVILVEDAKHQRSKLAGIALREKLLVDFDETLLGEQSVRTVFQESFVPVLCLWCSIRMFCVPP